MLRILVYLFSPFLRESWWQIIRVPLETAKGGGGERMTMVGKIESPPTPKPLGKQHSMLLLKKEETTHGKVVYFFST